MGIYSTLLLLIPLMASVAGAQSAAKPPCRIENQAVGYLNGDDEAFIDSLVSKAPAEQLSPLAKPSPLKPLPIEYLNPRNQAYYRDRNRTEYLLAEAAFSAMTMIRKAYDGGIRLFVHSGYRSYEQQCDVFRSKVLAEMKEKKSSLQATILSVNQRSAFPGESEHQLATTMDLVSDDRDVNYGLNDEFAKTAAYEWLQKNAVDFGFALSYPPSPSGGVSSPHPQTKIIFEPWHWRYIGESNAREFKICSPTMTLQEFLRALKKDPQYNCRS